jgi:rhamnulokinase
LLVHGNGGETRCVAIDLGASNGRVIAGRIASGRIELTEVHRFQTPVAHDVKTGYLCWDIDGILRDVLAGLDMCGQTGPIGSIGVDSWGVDYVLLDQRMELVGKAISYRDRRTAGVMDRILTRIAPGEIYGRTGIQFQPFNTLYQLAASCDQQPDWMERARHLLMIPDYIHYKLSGTLSNEYTNATTTQMYNLGGRWDETLMQAAGLSQPLMQPVLHAGAVLGKAKVQQGWAAVIAPATHDTASAVAGTPLASCDEAYISSGTWSLMGIECRTPIITDAARRMNFTNEGGFEQRYRLLKNITGMWPLQRICHEHRAAVDDALVTEVAAFPPWQSVIDPNDECFLNPQSMTDTIRAYCRRNSQPEPETVAEFARCVFDSLALSYRKVKEELEVLRQREMTRIRILGGGCRNHLLNQLCADACQLPVSAGPVEATALGNLCAQFVTLGKLESLDGARALIRNSFPPHEFEPKNNLPEGVWERFVNLSKLR